MPRPKKNYKFLLIAPALIAVIIAMLTPDIYFLSFLLGVDRVIIIFLAVIALICIVVYAITKPKAFLKRH